MAGARRRRSRSQTHRRASPRVEVDLRARIEIRTRSGRLHDVGTGRIRAMNVAGLFLTDLRFPKGSFPVEPFTLRVGVERPEQSPARGPTIRVWCEPVHLAQTKGGRVGLGARFVRLSQASKTRLKEFLA